MIYVSHSIKLNYREILYEPIKSSHLYKSYQFVFPHYEESEGLFKTKDFFLLGSCKLVLAEVSLPSTGQGIELGWADIFQIPIICIYNQDYDISSALTYISNTFIEYRNTDDMLNKLTDALA